MKLLTNKLLQKTFAHIRFYCYKPVARSKTFKDVKQPDQEISLSKRLEAKILASGPITVADYMRDVLTSPKTGYYMSRDVFGEHGDFVTSPEISQMFGEMLAIWMLNELYKIGNPRPLQIIEFGPGRGSLMQDILRVFKHFKQLKDTSVHFIEISPYLSSIQAQNFCSGSDVNTGISPYNPQDPHKPFYQSGVTQDDVEIYWYKKLDNVPKGFSVILAHEFFDALPVHKFQKMEKGWREILISVNKNENGEKFEYVLSPGLTPIGKVFLKPDETREHVEICPDGAVIAEEIAIRLEEDGGFSLFVDYGHDGEKTDTFRAFKNHKLHDPLVNPGSADLTADVDFSFLRQAAKDRVVTYGPVNQGDFLKRLGIENRLKNLLKVVDDKDKPTIQSGYNMIVDSDQMGKRFKCFSMFPKVLKTHLDKFPVAGFTDIAKK